MRQTLSTVLQATGFVVIIIGLGLFSLPAALIAAGILLTLTGFALGVDQ